MTTGQNNPQLAIERLWPQVMASPELHLHQIDLIQQAGLFVQMPPGAYRAASFLDGRSFTNQTVGSWIPLQKIHDTVLAGAAPATPLHFIFHMGHTGSTLLSRLLDQTEMVQPLREPLVLRDLATLHDSKGDPATLLSAPGLEALTEVMLRLWSRCRKGRQCAILKATSSAARISATLMAERSSSRGVYLAMRPEPYLAVILGGPASIFDIRGHAEERMRRVIHYLGSAPAALHDLSSGELTAMSWVTEALSRERLSGAVGERLLKIDFDEFLGNVAGGIQQVLDHFELAAGAGAAERIAQSPVLGQYAKAPEHGYSRQLRNDVIQNSRSQNRAEISRGMTLLENLGGRYPEVKNLLDDSG